jgi:hypothetical protein
MEVNTQLHSQPPRGWRGRHWVPNRMPIGLGHGHPPAGLPCRLHRLCWLLRCFLRHLARGEGHEHLTDPHQVSLFDVDLCDRTCTGRRHLYDGLIGLDL